MNAEFTFLKPYKAKSKKWKVYFNNPQSQYYEKQHIVKTDYGDVLLSELNWAHNFGSSVFTFFTAIIHGMEYQAHIGIAPLSEQTAKTLAIKFIKTIVNAYA